MLEKKDLQAIAELIDARANKTEELLRESESAIVNELVRIEDRLSRRIAKVEKNLEELNQYYRIAKLESDNTSLLLKMINDLQKEVDTLKSKIA